MKYTPKQKLFEHDFQAYALTSCFKSVKMPAQQQIKAQQQTQPRVRKK